MADPTADDIRKLPLPDLAMKILPLASVTPTLSHLLWGRVAATHKDEPDLSSLQSRIAEAWAWLQAHALIAIDPQNMPQTPGHRLTELGRNLMDDESAISKVWAADRLSGDLDPALASARTNFALGDYETASFAAMKAVEVSVRNAADLPNELLGVNLMRKAFNPNDGALRDHDGERGEQQATADLFAGAIGTYKNPASHRTVEFDDPIEAAEVIQLADLLLRIVRRAEKRAAAGGN